MQNTVKRLDLDKNLGHVTLSDDETKLPVPKLSLKRLIKIVKYLGIEGTKLWGDVQETLNDQTLETTEKIIVVLEELEEEQLFKIFSILLDLEEEEVVQLDLNEMLDIILVYVEETNLSKTFSQVRRLYKGIFNQELPDVGKWIQEKQEIGTEILAKRKAAEAEAKKQDSSMDDPMQKTDIEIDQAQLKAANGLA